MADDKPKHELVSRKDAIARGLKHYFTGKPCKRDHVDIRFTNNLTCYTCIRERMNKRKRDHPDRIRAIDKKARKKYYAKNKKRLNALTVAWQRKNPERVLVITKRYAERHAEKIRKNAVQYYWSDPEKARARGRLAYKKNPEPMKAYSRDWAKKNPERVRVNGANRRALKRKAGGTYTADDIKRIFAAQGGRCAYCRAVLKKYHVDHIMPLSKGGSNHAKNIQLTCQPCNQLKYSHDPMDFARRRLGRLL